MPRKSYFYKPALVLISLLVSFGILVGATSNFLSTSSPEIAIRINPFNTQARINLLTAKLSPEAVSVELEKLKRIAENGINLNPIDARLFSFLGIIENQKGNANKSQKLFLHALKLLPTELYALSRRFEFSANNGEYVQAVSIADMLSRRSPAQWRLVAPHMARLLRDKAAYNEAEKRFSTYPQGINRLINALSKDKNTVQLANRLLLDWKDQGKKNLRPAINLTVGRLVSFKQYSSAYRLFISTLNDEEEAEYGYVFNRKFELDPTGNLFDWKLIKQAGVNTKLTSVSTRSPENEVARIRAYEFKFLDTPVRLSQTLQYLRLPPSSFTLSVVYSTRNLKSKNPIRILIECQQNRRFLAAQEFSPGNNEPNEKKTSFSVPATDCELQQIRIFNGNVVEGSWKYRYSGSLFLHSVAITLTGG